MRNNEERLGSNPARHDANVPPQLMQAPQGDASSQTQLNFISPTEFVALPSRGKFYPASHPLHNKEVVEVKQMTAKEEDILTSKSLIKKGVVVDRLVEALLVDKSVRVDDLLIADKNAIVVNARVGAYGPNYDTVVTCPSCQSKSNHSFDLAEKVDPEEEPELIETTPSGTFFLELPKTKWKVELRGLNSRDEKQIVKLVSGDNKKAETESSLTQQIKLMVVSIQGEQDRSIINRAIEVMPAMDTKFLRREFAKMVPDLSLTKTFICDKCSHEERMEVPITAEFFWPK